MAARPSKVERPPKQGKTQVRQQKRKREQDDLADVQKRVDDLVSVADPPLVSLHDCMLIDYRRRIPSLGT